VYNILLTGIGGQGTVLAAKILAYAAHEKGFEVRTAETIGMAQRGGSVISHVRIGNVGESVHEPLIAKKSAQLIIAFEPAEAVRVLPYLARDGLLVTAKTGVPSVMAELTNTEYKPEDLLNYLQEVLPQTVVVDDATLCAAVGKKNAMNTTKVGKSAHRPGGKKVLNTILLASALRVLEKNPQENISVPLLPEDLKGAICKWVKKDFVDINLIALDMAISAKE
jgi:indolepyruvate ferredoxin oxidoreductase, beta subunit